MPDGDVIQLLLRQTLFPTYTYHFVHVNVNPMLHIYIMPC